MLFVLGLFPVVENSDWINYVSDEGRFSVLVPGQFVTNQKSIPTEVGELPCKSFVYQDTLGHSKNELYVISYCDYPSGTFHRDSVSLIDEVLEVSVDQEREILNGNVTYNHKTKVEGYPGRIFRLNYQNGEVVMKSKIFLVGDRFYTIQVYTLYKHNLNFNVDKFFNSFRLIED